MSIQKVFAVLITVVACLFVGAFVLNTLLPNAVAQSVNGIEGAIYNGTGFNVNINGDDVQGKDASNDAAADANGGVSDDSGATDTDKVGGYDGFNAGGN